MPRLRIKRGTRAQLNSAATASELASGEPYLITDESRLAIGLTTSTYESFAKVGEASGSTDWANPGAIGSSTRNTGSFTTITGSRFIVAGILANNVTLTRTAHCGRSLLVDGGVINLPLDTDWLAGDELEFIFAGPNPVTLQWTGAAIVSAAAGAAVTQTISGGIGNSFVVKKMGANVAYLFAASPSAVGTPFDPWQRAEIRPATGNNISQIGFLSTTVGTIGTPQPTAGTAYSEAHRFTVSSSTTAGTLASMRSTTLRLWRGNAIAKGGFSLSIPFGLAALQAGMRGFTGIDSATANATNVDPLTSSTTSKVGLAINNNTGNWNLINNAAGTAPTVLALNANFPVDITTWMELRLRSAANGGAIAYDIINKNTGFTQSGSLTTNIPAPTTFMHFYPWVCNNATAAAVSMALGRVMMEFG